MVEVKKEGVILLKTEYEFENEGVLNPAAFQEGDIVHLFYRAVRKGNNSTIGYCRLVDFMIVDERKKSPMLFPEFPYESKGVEDPRITKIDDTYYMSYTAYDGNVALGALATSSNLTEFKKQGIIVPVVHCRDFHRWRLNGHEETGGYHRYNKGNHVVWDKNLVFFPRRINGKLCFLHRIRPDIQFVSVNDLSELTIDFWENYIRKFDEHILMKPKYGHEKNYIGAGCPPIETSAGWLMIYHGVNDTGTARIYSACAALLDLDNPSKEIARLPYPLFGPQHQWELEGEVNNVCFPTGSAISGNTLYIYYGAADERIACATVNINSLLKELLENKF